MNVIQRLGRAISELLANPVEVTVGIFGVMALAIVIAILVSGWRDKSRQRKRK